jgi:hypothetical protein
MQVHACVPGVQAPSAPALAPGPRPRPHLQATACTWPMTALGGSPSQDSQMPLAASLPLDRKKGGKKDQVSLML